MGAISDFAGTIATPFFQNPYLFYVLALIIVGADASSAMFMSQAPLQSSVSPILNDAYNCTRPDLIQSFFDGLGLRGLTYCKDPSDTTGVIGTGLSAMFHGFGLPQEVQISSAMIFFVMLFSGVFVWAGTALTRD